jgi:translocation and assembly module TamA
VQQHLVLRRLDSVLLPTQGYSLALQYGGDQARSNTGQSGPFGRLYGRATLYWPLGLQWYGSARAEAGQVIKRDAVVVPDALGFRAGGDESVRGYGYRELAPQRDGHIVSGNVLLTGSVELARPIVASLPSVWGAVFVDAGRAAERWQGLKPALGYGVGVRWRSPIGPLRADLAYGQDLRKVRLHLSVGVNF